MENKFEQILEQLIPDPKSRENLQAFFGYLLVPKQADPPPPLRNYKVSIALKHENPHYITIQAHSEKEAEELARKLIPGMKKKYREAWTVFVQAREI